MAWVPLTMVTGFQAGTFQTEVLKKPGYIVISQDITSIGQSHKNSKRGVLDFLLDVRTTFPYKEEGSGRGFLCKLSITSFPLYHSIKTPLLMVTNNLHIAKPNAPYSVVILLDLQLDLSLL